MTNMKAGQMRTDVLNDEAILTPITTLAPASVVRRLPTLDRFLPLWIFAAIALGIALGRIFPGLGTALNRVQVAGVSVPIGIGLLWMMYPVLAKVRYESIGPHIRDTKLLGTSLFFNWVLGPIVMFALAWAFLPDLPSYRNGLVLIGLARCIAMVLIWNSLACGSAELAAVLVALNSVFQILTYSFLGWLFLSVVPGWFGSETAVVHVSIWAIAKSVLIFLGIPLLAGYLTRRILVARRGEMWYDGTFMPRFGPTALVGLLYTIVLMFAMQGDRILHLPFDVLRIAVPLVIYFFVMFGLAFAVSKRLGFGYQETASLSFTAAGNNFELAIAVAVATFGIGSGEALAAVVGPLIEVPALIGLVYVSLWAGRRFFGFTPDGVARMGAAEPGSRDRGV
jgi:ACR3 family arsenite transporter